MRIREQKTVIENVLKHLKVMYVLICEMNLIYDLGHPFYFIK